MTYRQHARTRRITSEKADRELVQAPLAADARSLVVPGRGAGVPRRSGDVTTQAVGNEYVVLDPVGRIHNLTGPAATVWRAAGEGVMPPGLSEDTMASTTATLVALGLLQEDHGGVSRRAVLVGSVAAGIGLVGITTLTLPTLAAADSASHTLTYASDGTLTIPAMTTVSFALIGGGGGPGFDTADIAGGSGGAGAVISGTLENTTDAVVTLDVVIGAGGSLAEEDGAPSGGASTVSAGGDGYQNQGGGGGASAIVNSADGLFVSVAGGGGGGTQSSPGPGGFSPGGDGGDAATTSTLGSAPSTAAGGQGLSGGAGGGGGAPGGSGGHGVAPGTGGGSYFPASVDGLNITASATSASSGPGTGGSNTVGVLVSGQAGQATFTGPGIAN